MCGFVTILTEFNRFQASIRVLKTNEDTGAGVYKWGLKRGHSLCFGLHTMVFQAEIYANNACIMENIEKGHRGKNGEYRKGPQR